MSFKQRQDQLIEKDPLVFEEFVEKVTHVIAGDDWSEHTKYPLTCIDICPDVIFRHIVVNHGQIRLDKHFNHQAVLE